MRNHYQAGRVEHHDFLDLLHFIYPPKQIGLHAYFDGNRGHSFNIVLHFFME